MKRFLALALIVGVSTLGFVGCDQTTEVKKTTETNTPDGKIKETDTSKVEKSGAAKDPAP